VPGERLTGEEDALQVQVHDPVVVGLGHLGEGPRCAPAGVIDQDIEPAEVAGRLLDQPRGLRGGPQVGLYDQPSLPGGLHLGADIVRLVGAAGVVDDDVRPLVSQPEGDGAPDAPAAAGDHAALPANRCIAALLVRCGDHAPCASSLPGGVPRL
jgi:hypothetical protein